MVQKKGREETVIPVSSSLVGLLAFLVIVFVFIVLQLSSHHGAAFGFGYWLIPDSVTNYELTSGLVKGQFLLSDFLGSAGVPLYYSPFFILGIVGFIAANVFLLAIGARYYGSKAIYVPLLLYPFYLQLLVLPSKDMMVLPIYFFAMYHLTRGDWWRVLIVSVGAYFIRDGAMFVLLPLLVAAVVIEKTRIRALWIIVIAFFSCMLVFSVLQEVAGDLLVVSRNLYALQAEGPEQLRELNPVLGYLARMFFNLTNSAFRLTFIDERGLVSIGSISLYISGISNLVCCSVAARRVFQSEEKTAQLISVCYFLSLLIISMNPFVQGRYQLPMSIVASVILFPREKMSSLGRLYILIIVISLVARAMYGYLNIPLPPHMGSYEVDLLSL